MFCKKTTIWHKKWFTLFCNDSPIPYVGLMSKTYLFIFYKLFQGIIYSLIIKLKKLQHYQPRIATL